MPSSTRSPGFLALHSNRSEELATTVAHWLARQPLNPLEQEIILVQSNGMAEWIKMELARIGGVCAATQVELPARFLWRTYRQVLGPDAVPAQSALDKVPMTWRIMALLPELITQAVFAPVAGFLQAFSGPDGDATDRPARQLQLSSRLADLFDQYQIYRADWLQGWSAGRDDMVRADGKAEELPAEQRWQPVLWRALVATLDERQAMAIRPRLQERVLQHLASGAPLHAPVARRITAFGMSSMPLSTMQALAALGQHSQVLLAISNPCQYHWADIMEGRELLNFPRQRQPMRAGSNLAALPLQDMHAHAHPLLAAWGRQGRDFIRQLDEFDNAALAQQQFDLPRIDLFDEPALPAAGVGGLALLAQVQAHIRDLTPLSEHPQVSIAPDDRSVVFHLAHSKVRELEVLHDQLLELLAKSTDGARLSPRDIVVMVPDITPMAPAIRAVFGQYKPHDARFIPFDIADLSAKSSSPVMGAVEWLLRLPQMRCRMSELVDFLEVPAVAARFGIDLQALPRLTRWMVGAGIRWGLNEEHRADLGLLACGDQNSAWFGLHRMLLGYACGVVPHQDAADTGDLASAFEQMDPYGEVGGLDAALAGALAHVLQSLVQWWLLARQPATTAQWQERGALLLDAMFKDIDDTDRAALAALRGGLRTWRDACSQAQFTQAVPLSVARSAWMEALETPSLNRRFRAGGVTFCTLMPMRAVPFEVVCLLGMNDGDYPRSTMRSDFDLMGLPHQSRPGDRSRRLDDRQLMLEALLSARRVLYVSWCGRSVRDNSEQAPSVLVSQLRDYLSAGWGEAVVKARTTEHPLQPFSRRYFEKDSVLMTYAREWRTAHLSHSGAGSGDETSTVAGAAATPAIVKDVPLTLVQLAQFLRNPVKAFFRQRLNVVFDDNEQAQADDESFGIAGLDAYTLINELTKSLPAQLQVDQVGGYLEQALTQLLRSGRLPLKGMGELTRQQLQAELASMVYRWFEQQQCFAYTAERLSVSLQHEDLMLQDWLDHLRCTHSALADRVDDVAPPVTAWLTLEPAKLCDKKGKVRPEKLLSAWTRSLAAAACGHICHGVLVGRDATLLISPCPQVAAQEHMAVLLQLWRVGMQAPLPLPVNTALAYAQNKNPAELYEGGMYIGAEGDEPCLARMYADFEALAHDGQFYTLAGMVYRPMLVWIKDHVQVINSRAEEEEA